MLSDASSYIIYITVRKHSQSNAYGNMKFCIFIATIRVDTRIHYNRVSDSEWAARASELERELAHVADTLCMEFLYLFILSFFFHLRPSLPVLLRNCHGDMLPFQYIDVDGNAFLLFNSFLFLAAFSLHHTIISMTTVRSFFSSFVRVPVCIFYSHLICFCSVYHGIISIE